MYVERWMCIGMRFEIWFNLTHDLKDSKNLISTDKKVESVIYILMSAGALHHFLFGIPVLEHW